MSPLDALQLVIGLLIIGVGSILIVGCIVVVMILIATGRHEAGKIEHGERQR